MYFPLGWAKVVDSPDSKILKVVTDKVKILFAVLHENSICIWFCKPSVPIVCYNRSEKCKSENGENTTIEWKLDSSKIAVAVKYLHFWNVEF